jgi:hypothetical protein
MKRLHLPWKVQACSGAGWSVGQPFRSADDFRGGKNAGRSIVMSRPIQRSVLRAEEHHNPCGAALNGWKRGAGPVQYSCNQSRTDFR